MRIFGIVALAAAGAAVCASSAFAAKDNFDRADLGKKWKIVASSLVITGNQLHGGDGSLGYHKKSASANSGTITVFLSGTAIQYGAVALGDIANRQNAFVKIQEQNGGGTFDHAAFYDGNNGNGSFFVLTSPVPSPATLTATLCGSVAKMTIKSSSGTQTFSYDYGASFGPGGGLGIYGPIALDNYKSKAASCSAFSEETIVIRGSNAKDLSLPE